MKHFKRVGGAEDLRDKPGVVRKSKAEDRADQQQAGSKQGEREPQRRVEPDATDDQAEGPSGGSFEKQADTSQEA